MKFTGATAKPPLRQFVFRRVHVLRDEPTKMTRVTLPNCLNVGVHLIPWDPLGYLELKSLFVGIKGGGGPPCNWGYRPGGFLTETCHIRSRYNSQLRFTQEITNPCQE